MSQFQNSALFRYFFFHWLFRDASVQEPYQRNAALTHNRTQRHHLLTYLRRWFALMLFMLFTGILLEHINAWTSMVFYSMASLCVCTLAKIAVAWIFLGQKNPLSD